MEDIYCRRNYANGQRKTNLKLQITQLISVYGIRYLVEFIQFNNSKQTLNDGQTSKRFH